MENKDQPAFPLNPDIETSGNVDYTGMTKREHFAGLAMQGYLANPSFVDQGPGSIAISSIQCADALLKALEQ